MIKLIQFPSTFFYLSITPNSTGIFGESYATQFQQIQIKQKYTLLSRKKFASLLMTRGSLGILPLSIFLPFLYVCLFFVFVLSLFWWRPISWCIPLIVIIVIIIIIIIIIFVIMIVIIFTCWWLLYLLVSPTHQGWEQTWGWASPTLAFAPPSPSSSSRTFKVDFVILCLCKLSIISHILFLFPVTLIYILYIETSFLIITPSP